MDKFFKVPPEVFAVDSLMSLAVLVRTVIFRFRKYKIVLDRLPASYPLLVLDGTEDLINGEPQWGEVLFRAEGPEWTRKENQERLLLEDMFPQILVTAIGQSLTL